MNIPPGPGPLFPSERACAVRPAGCTPVVRCRVQTAPARQATRRGLARNARSVRGLAPSKPGLSDSREYEAERLRRLIPYAIKPVHCFCHREE
ncbi:hypothetical protein MHYP_G00090320 [Metynnis hypsauchen]